MGRPKKYATDEERRLARNARARLKYDREKEKERINRYELLEKKRAYSKKRTIRIQNDPVLREKRNIFQRNSSRKNMENISTGYVAKIMRLNVSECSEELIEMKKQQIIVARQIRSLNKLLKETENG